MAIDVARDVGGRTAGRGNGSGDRIIRLMMGMIGMLGGEGKQRQGQAGQQQGGAG